VDSSIINIAGFCSGVGMLDEAVGVALDFLGYEHRLALLCEWEGYAAACLLARMEEQSMEPCPIWCGDLRDFEAKSFSGLVDVLCAGLPCQPYSCAGKQRGLEDERSFGDDGTSGPIPHFLRIVAECLPAVVFVENVPPWVSGGWFRPVGEELCRLGYEIESPLFVTAEAVKASHRRERVFVLAHYSSARRRMFARGNRRESGAGEDEVRSGRVWQQQRSAVDEQPELHDEQVADTSRSRRSKDSRGSLGHEAADGRTGRNGSKPDGDNEPECTDSTLGNARSSRADQSRGSIQRQPEQQSGRTIESGRRHTAVADAERPRPQGNGPGIALGRDIALSRDPDGRVFAPGPSADWQAIPEHLWPAIEPGFRLLADGLAVVLDESRADQLRCGGNGVVAVQAAVAFIELAKRSQILKGN
jgi:DNA (cytosine-5)-methyltransferase 1